MTTPAGRTKATVLLVEDSFLLAMELERKLAEVGFAVLGPFANLVDSRTAILGRAPDFAVLDVNIHGGTSLALAAELVTNGVPCVFLTGYSQIPDLPAKLSHVAVLAKPVEFKELLSALREPLR